MNLRNVMNMVIGPALRDAEMHSDDACRLVLETGLVESGYREIAQQPNGGPALGFWQMEGPTHDDIWKNYLQYRPELAKRIIWASSLDMPANSAPSSVLLVYHLRYAAIMCRVHYMRVPDALPTDLEGRAAYWKAFFNTAGGKGTVEKYIQTCRGIDL